MAVSLKAFFEPNEPSINPLYARNGSPPTDLMMIPPTTTAVRMASNGIKPASEIDCKICLVSEFVCFSDCILRSSGTCELSGNYIKQVISRLKTKRERGIYLFPFFRGLKNLLRRLDGRNVGCNRAVEQGGVEFFHRSLDFSRNFALKIVEWSITSKAGEVA